MQPEIEERTPLPAPPATLERPTPPPPPASFDAQAEVDPFASPGAASTGGAQPDDPFWFRSAGSLLGNGEAPLAPSPDAGLQPDREPAPPAAAEPGPELGHGLELERRAEPSAVTGPLALEEPPAKTGARPLDAGGIDLGFGDPGAPWDLEGAATSTPQEAGAVSAEVFAVPPAPEAAADAPVGSTPTVRDPPAGSAARSPEAPAPGVASAAPVPPGKAATTSPARTGRLRRVLSDSLWLLLLVALAAALLFAWRGHIASRLRSAGSPPPAGPVLEISNVRGGLYDTASGAPALVVRGEVVARTAATGPVRVRIELLEGGRSVATAEGLAGGSATAEEVFAASSPDQVADLRRALDQGAARALAAGERAPFLFVFPPPAPDPHGLDLRATAEPAGPAAPPPR